MMSLQELFGMTSLIERALGFRLQGLRKQMQMYVIQLVIDIFELQVLIHSINPLPLEPTHDLTFGKY